MYTTRVIKILLRLLLLFINHHLSYFKRKRPVSILVVLETIVNHVIIPRALIFSRLSHDWLSHSCAAWSGVPL